MKLESMSSLRWIGWFALLVLLLASFGCANSVNLKVESDVPDALVEKLPLNVAVYFDDAFRNHNYSEDTEERPQWSIASGDAQVTVFSRVLESTFQQVTRSDQPPTPGSPTPFDLTVVPKIVEMQFATPDETGFDIYEAWVQYRIVLLGSEGEPQESWEIAAYGKAPKKRLAARTDGLNEAIGYALRDIGAKLSTGISQRPSVVNAIGSRQ